VAEAEVFSLSAVSAGVVERPALPQTGRLVETPTRQGQRLEVRRMLDARLHSSPPPSPT
jgi:hypothetical protein